MSLRSKSFGFLAAIAVVWNAPEAVAQAIPVTLVPGNFTYQFADPTTGQPITTLNIPTVGATAKVALYLLQTGGTPNNLLQQLGGQGLGVRLNYASPAGIVRVPDAFAGSIAARPPPVFNPNGVPSDYDFFQRTGSGLGTDTTLSASITEGLSVPTDPLPFPGPEDPLGNKQRMLIATFTLQASAPGLETLTAVHPASGTANISGPNPVLNGLRNDGTTGPLPGNGAKARF